MFGVRLWAPCHPRGCSKWGRIHRVTYLDPQHVT